jgi:hypothetical protein
MRRNDYKEGFLPFLIRMEEKIRDSMGMLSKT